MRREPAIRPESGVPYLRHELSALSMMAALGLPMRVIQDAVGHSMLATTADIYTHVAPQAMQDAADALDRAYGSQD